MFLNDLCKQTYSTVNFVSKSQGSSGLYEKREMTAEEVNRLGFEPVAVALRTQASV